jgi:hypothetical protein
MDRVPKKKIVSDKFHHALFSLLVCLTSLKLVLIGFPKTWVWNYHSMPCNISEKRRSHMIGDACLGLALHAAALSDPVWCLICELKMTSPNLREKNVILHLRK